MIRDAAGRRRIAPWLLLAFVFGVGGAQLAQVWWDRYLPKPVEVKDVQVYQLPDHGYALRVELYVPQTRSCLRVSQHLIYRDKTPGIPQELIPLASGLGDQHFQQLTPDTVTWLKVHPFTANGHWSYMLRFAYICTGFLGLTRVSEWQSNSYGVNLDTTAPLYDHFAH